MNKLRKIFQWLWQTKERLVLGIMVAVLAFQIFSVLRTEEDEFHDMPVAPKRQADRESLDPAPPELPPELPPRKPFVNPERLATNDPFDWREQSAAPGAEQVSLSTLRLLRIRGDGANAMVQIETETNRKWYRVGDAFESYEIISVDEQDGTAEIFDEGMNRTRIIRLDN